MSVSKNKQGCPIHSITKNGEVKRQEIWEYRLIDNNWTRHPVAYCRWYHGYLTEGLIKTHKCREKNCRRFQEDIEL